MASAHCSAFSLIAPSSARRNLPLILVSSKIRHRKNYLRPKILKTLNPLTYPTLPPLLPPPENPVLFPQEEELSFEAPPDETRGGDIAGAAGESDKLEDLRVSEATPERNGVYRKLSATEIFKYGGMFLVGAFVFQSIYAVWMINNYLSNEKDEELEVSGREKRNFFFNGNGTTVPVTGASNDFYEEDQLEMEERIEEIKLMAREVRRIESEKKKEEDEDLEVNGESSVSSNKLGIEKEIGARLLKLQGRISNSNKDSSAALHINARGRIARDGNKNVNQGNEALMFKKKLKYRSPSTKATKAPKGFSGTQDTKASNSKAKDSAVKSITKDYGSIATDHEGILYEDKQVNQPDVATEESISSVPLEDSGLVDDDETRANLNHGKNLEEKVEMPNKKTEARAKSKSKDNGGVPETSLGVSSLEGIQLKDSRNMRAQNSQGFVEEKQDTSPILEKDNVHSVNGSSRHGLAKKNSSDNRIKAKQVKPKIDMWWLNLRYVLVILMQRGSDGGGKGLYSVKFSSKEQGQSDDSYTVAFEDHADANNFCFLLESFFEDLGDFSADAVPMSIQELNEDIISRTKKVVVLKKRQLQLYAGQPLSDVEMTLRSIIQDQNAP